MPEMKTLPQGVQISFYDSFCIVLLPGEERRFRSFESQKEAEKAARKADKTLTAINKMIALLHKDFNL